MQTKQKIVTFKTKTGHYLERLMSETIKLLGSSKNKMNKDKKSKNVSHLEINEVLLHLILLTMIIAMIQEPFIHLFQMQLFLITNPLFSITRCLT